VGSAVLSTNMENQDTTVNLSNMTWEFSPEVTTAFKEMGIPIPGGLTSFILKILSAKKLQQGQVELTMLGLGFRIERIGDDFTVNLIEAGGD
jgi:hypothetical protein